MDNSQQLLDCRRALHFDVTLLDRTPGEERHNGIYQLCGNTPDGSAGAIAAREVRIIVPPPALIEVEDAESKSAPKIQAVMCPYCVACSNDVRHLLIRSHAVGFHHNSRGRGRSEWFVVNRSVMCERGHVLRFMKLRGQTEVMAFPSTDVVLALAARMKVKQTAQLGEVA